MRQVTLQGKGGARNVVSSPGAQGKLHGDFHRRMYAALGQFQGGRILIVHQGALGDFILALPAIKALREALQPVRLEVMGHPWILQLVETSYYADGILDVNKAEMAAFFSEGTHLPETMCGYLRRFDAAFIFSKAAVLAQNLQRVGIQGVFLLPPFPRERKHLMDHHLQSLAALGIWSTPAPPRILLWEQDKRWAKIFLRDRAWRGGNTVALHPGAGSPKKVWPPHRFALVGRALAKAGTKLLVIQGPADEELVEETVQGLKPVAPLVLRDLPLIQLAPLLTHCILFIGNDSGISHLAAALGVPTVAIFGPTDPSVWAPRGENAFWISRQAGCSPCSREQRQGCERQRCLEQIEVQDVMELCTKLMQLPREECFKHVRTTPEKRFPHRIIVGPEGMPSLQCQ